MARRRKIRPVGHDPATGRQVTAAPFFGLCVLAGAFFLYAAGVLFAPWWVVLIGLAVWASLLRVALGWWEPHPGRLPWLGAVAVVVWALLFVGGTIAFGWHGLWDLHAD